VGLVLPVLAGPGAALGVGVWSCRRWSASPGACNALLAAPCPCRISEAQALWLYTCTQGDTHAASTHLHRQPSCTQEMLTHAPTTATTPTGSPPTPWCGASPQRTCQGSASSSCTSAPGRCFTPALQACRERTWSAYPWRWGTPAAAGPAACSGNLLAASLHRGVAYCIRLHHGCCCWQKRAARPC
jgi:hypothetical protein